MALSAKQLQHWDDQGFLLLESFFSIQQIDQLNQLVDDLWRTRKKLDAQYVIDIFVETPNEKRVYFNDAPESARHAPYKLNDLFLSSEEIRQAIAGEPLAPILGELLGGFPMICNSLNFEFGSQQDYHFDTFYMPSPTPNKMIASWIALENATLDNGPLTYYPGSHNIPAYKFSNGTTLVIPEEMNDFLTYMEHEIVERDLQAETLLANKGDVLIWHSQLYHGGTAINDKSRTRKSLVTHYFTREDFPETQAPLVTDHSCYMKRPAQPTGYEFNPPKNWFNRLFG